MSLLGPLGQTHRQQGGRKASRPVRKEGRTGGGQSRGTHCVLAAGAAEAGPLVTRPPLTFFDAARNKSRWEELANGDEKTQQALPSRTRQDVLCGDGPVDTLDAKGLSTRRRSQSCRSVPDLKRMLPSPR